MKFGRWSWGYIPVALVLGLIWYEYWRSGAFAPPPHRDEPAETQTAGADPVPAPGADPAVERPKPEVDDAFLNSPTPITVSFSNVNLDSAVDSLRQALGPKATIQTINSGNLQNRTFSVDVKNAPFWDVIKAMGKQAPFDLQNAANYSMDGLVLSGVGSGLYRFETSGPAILCPISIAYNRQTSGQGVPGEQVVPRYNLRVGAAVDPRIRVTGWAPVEVTEAVDDMGRTIVVAGGGGNFSTQPSNYWDSTLNFSSAEPHAAKATFKCVVRFVAQLSEFTVTVDDPTQKVGQSFTLADRTMRLARCEIQGNQLTLQVALDIPQPQMPIAFTVMGANGRSVSHQTQSGSMRSVALNNMSGPYKLIFRAPDQVREVALPFELKDIPLP